MKLTLSRTLLLTTVLAVAAPLLAQQKAITAPALSASAISTSDAPYRGFNAFENLRGLISSNGSLLKLDSTLGYDFNRHFGLFAGVPLYFTNNSGTSTGFGNVSDNGIGDAYFGVNLYAPNHFLNYSTTLTVSAPTGSVAKGFSPGEVTADWTSRVRRSFGRLSPFVAAGVGNTVPDSELITRSFSSLGTVVHSEEGAEFDLTRHVYVGGSAYQVFPFGNQQVFNRLDGGGNRGQGGNGAGGEQNDTPGNNAQLSASATDLTREHGFDAWIGFEPARAARLEFGFTRSTTFATNSFSFNLGLNVGRLLHSKSSARN